MSPAETRCAYSCPLDCVTSSSTALNHGVCWRQKIHLALLASGVWLSAVFWATVSADKGPPEISSPSRVAALIVTALASEPDPRLVGLALSIEM